MTACTRLQFQARPSPGFFGRACRSVAKTMAAFFVAGGLSLSPGCSPEDRFVEPDKQVVIDPKIDEQPPYSPCPATHENFTDCFPTSGVKSDNGCFRVGSFCQEMDEACIAGYLTSNAPDALPDLICTNMVIGTRVYQNIGEMQFRNITTSTGLIDSDGKALFGYNAAIGDLDHDGWDDIIMVVLPPKIAAQVFFSDPRGTGIENNVRIYRNEGHGRFSDVTKAWGFKAFVDSGSFGAALEDINRDGRLDVVFWKSVKDVQETPREGQESIKKGQVLVYISQPDGTWTEQGKELFGIVRGESSPWTVLWADVNRDGWRDFVVLSNANSDSPQGMMGMMGSNNSVSHLFLRIPGTLRFTEMPVEGFDRFDAMGGSIADLPYLGTVLAISDVGKHHVCSWSKSNPPKLTDIAITYGLNVSTNITGIRDSGNFVGFAARWLDFNGDGLLDHYITGARDGNRGLPHIRVLINNMGTQGTFADESELFLGPHRKHAASGLAVADFDGDGRFDLMPSSQGVMDRDQDGKIDVYPPEEVKKLQLLWNQNPNGHPVSIRLRGHRSNTTGIGASIIIRTPDGIEQRVEIEPGGVAYGGSEPRAFFNLGPNRTARIIVEWPNGWQNLVQELDLHVAEGAVSTRMTIEEPL